MMKRDIKSIMLSSFALTLLNSCNVMDTKPFETYSEDLVWSSYKTAEAFVFKVYPDVMQYYAGGSASSESLTPNGAQCDQVNAGVNTYATETDIDAFTDLGFGRFTTQRNCNMIIEKATASTIFTEDEKKVLIAEAHFLRGALYFDMARKMGRFVPITKVLTTNDKELFATPLTASVEVSYDYVMADLDIACENLPAKSVSGRANKYVALLFRSRAALQAYAYTKDAKYIDIAINSAKEVIADGGYALDSNYEGLFNEETFSAPGSEIIMSRYYLNSDSNVGNFTEMIEITPNLPNDEAIKGSADGVATLIPTVKTFDGWARFWPTQDLVDQYLMIDEATGKAVEWHQASQIINNVDFAKVSDLAAGSIEAFVRHDKETRQVPTVGDMKTDRSDYPLFKYHVKVKSTSTKDFTDLFYGNRDKRLDATIVRDKTKWQNETLDLNTGGNASQGMRTKPDGGWYTTTTGYYWRKNTVTADPRVFYDTKINFQFVIARLGEAYMNLAEAYLLKNEPANAVTALNMTRTTHGGLPASTAASIDEAWVDYIRERRVEMAYENGDIFYSYLRWGKYGGASNDGKEAGAIIKDLDCPVYKISISSDRKQAAIGQLTLLESENRKFSSKRYLYPIPKGQMDKRAASGIVDTQNHGW